MALFPMETGGGTTLIYATKSVEFTSSNGTATTTIDLSSLGISNFAAIYLLCQIRTENVVAACYMWNGSSYTLQTPCYTWDNGEITNISLNQSTKVLSLSYKWNPLGQTNAAVVCYCVGS